MMIETVELSKVLSTIGERIARRRRSLKMSQERLAEFAGLSRDHVAKIELALRSPSLAAAISLARALDMQLSELFADQKAETDAVAQGIADLLNTLTTSEAQFIMTLLCETADYPEATSAS